MHRGRGEDGERERGAGGHGDRDQQRQQQHQADQPQLDGDLQVLVVHEADRVAARRVGPAQRSRAGPAPGQRLGPDRPDRGAQGAHPVRRAERQPVPQRPRHQDAPAEQGDRGAGREPAEVPRGVRDHEAGGEGRGGDQRAGRTSLRERGDEPGGGDRGPGRRCRRGPDQPPHPGAGGEHDQAGEQGERPGATPGRGEPGQQRGEDGRAGGRRRPVGGGRRPVHGGEPGEGMQGVQGVQGERGEHGGGGVRVGQRGGRPPHPLAGHGPRREVQRDAGPAGRRHQQADAEQPAAEQLPVRRAGGGERAGDAQGEQCGPYAGRDRAVQRTPGQRPQGERDGRDEQHPRHAQHPGARRDGQAGGGQDRDQQLPGGREPALRDHAGGRGEQQRDRSRLPPDAPSHRAPHRRSHPDGYGDAFRGRKRCAGDRIGTKLPHLRARVRPYG